VVCSDIGTSPIYTRREDLGAASTSELSAEEMAGAVSSLLWTLILIVLSKCVVFDPVDRQPRRRGMRSRLARAERAAKRRTGHLLTIGIMDGHGAFLR